MCRYVRVERPWRQQVLPVTVSVEDHIRSDDDAIQEAFDV